MAKAAASFLSSLLAGGGGGGGGGAGGPAATVASIFVYPIKSCRGISVPQAPVTATGFRWDRQWMVVNAKGRAYTQRVEPKLALVQVELPPEAFAEDWHPTPDDHMVIRAPGMQPLKIPLASKRATIYDISVWEWSGSAYDEGAEAAEWFSTFLGNPTRLVRFKEESETRLTNPDYARGYTTMFSDGFPFMITSQGSLDALNEILEEPIPINRFRPNILVEGCHPYAEDLWKTIKINKLTFQGVKLCGRCKVPTINQDTGIPSPTEPTETLQKYRSGEVLLPSHKNKRQVYFGPVAAVARQRAAAAVAGRVDERAVLGVPASLCDIGNLTKMIMFNNVFPGPIPAGLHVLVAYPRARAQQPAQRHGAGGAPRARRGCSVSRSPATSCPGRSHGEIAPPW